MLTGQKSCRHQPVCAPFVRLLLKKTEDIYYVHRICEVGTFFEGRCRLRELGQSVFHKRNVDRMHINMYKVQSKDTHHNCCTKQIIAQIIQNGRPTDNGCVHD